MLQPAYSHLSPSVSPLPSRLHLFSVLWTAGVLKLFPLHTPFQVLAALALCRHDMMACAVQSVHVICLETKAAVKLLDATWTSTVKNTSDAFDSELIFGHCAFRNLIFTTPHGVLTHNLRSAASQRLYCSFHPYATTKNTGVTKMELSFKSTSYCKNSETS